MRGLLEEVGTQEVGSPQQEEAMAIASDMGDPALAKAIDFLEKRIYEEGIDEQIASAFDDSPVPAPKNIAQVAYSLAEKADEVTGGEIEEENLAILGMISLNEVIEIAQAAGMKPSPGLPAEAMQELVLIFAKEHGLPEAELRQAMSQIDDEQLAAAAMEAPENLDEEISQEDSPVGENIESGLGGQRNG